MLITWLNRAHRREIRHLSHDRERQNSAVFRSIIVCLHHSTVSYPCVQMVSRLYFVAITELREVTERGCVTEVLQNIRFYAASSQLWKGRCFVYLDMILEIHLFRLFQYCVISNFYDDSKSYFHFVCLLLRLWQPRISFSLIQVFIELFVLHQFPDLGSCKYALLDFCVAHIWELIPHTFASTTGFMHTFHKVFHGAQLYVQMGQIYFLRKNKRRIDDIFLPWRQWCSFSPQSIYTVILLVPAVPLAQETAVFCVS